MWRDVGDFSPMTQGFRFSNSFPPAAALTIAVPQHDPIPIGNVANGLCGGMAFAARDFYEFKVQPPSDALPPLPETLLFDYLVNRLVDSLNLPDGPFRYFQWMGLPDQDLWLGRGLRSMSIQEEWPKIRRSIDNRHPVPLGLIRVHSLEVRDLGQNHQVLCYGYEAEGSVLTRLLIYDPNYPGAEVSIAPAPGGELEYSTGERLRGFFVSKYKRVDPRFLVDATITPPQLSLTPTLARLRGPVGR
jgi:hypothetical protein